VSIPSRRALARQDTGADALVAGLQTFVLRSVGTAEAVGA
jgi:hypothetical protein